MEEPVDGRAGAADVGAEGSEAAQLGGERRRGEVVRRQRREVARAAHGRERRLERGAPAPPSPPRRPLVEAPVDGRRRVLAGAVREREDDPVVLRQVERRELGAVAAPSCGPAARKNGTSAPSVGRERAQALVGQRRGKRLVREAKRGRGVGAAAAEAGRDGDPLGDRRRASAARRPAAAASASSASRTSVSPAKPVDPQRRRRRDRDAVARGRSRCSTVATSCLPSVAAGPTTSARLSFAVAGARSSQRVGQRDELGGRERLGPGLGAAPDRLERGGCARRGRRGRRARASSAASCGGGRTPPRRRA